ncbi:MAG: murein biosynthesis integral membrane protein MurJ [Actinomycetota bacterium]
MSGDWGQPSLYGRGLVTVEPRLFTEADPVPSIAMPPWQQISDDDWDAGMRAVPPQEPQWSAPTYVGPRRHRPAAGGSDRPSAPRQGAQTSNRELLTSSRTMAIASLASRVTGFLRSVVLAAALGTGLVADAYNGANSFPNMVYELLLGGVLSSVLIPLLVNAQEHDADHGEAYTQRLLSLATVALGAATLLAAASAPAIAAAFVSDSAQRDLTSSFATLLLPEIFFYGLGAMFTAILNIRQVYGPGAWAPVLNNLVTIAAVGVFVALPGPATLNPANMTTAQVLVLGVGTTVGIVAQAVVLLPALRRAGFRWRWRFRAAGHETGAMKEAGTLTGWVIGYVAASQVGVFVIVRVAFGHNGVTTFTYADLLFQVPYGILGVSLLTALMPRMSRAAARGETSAVIDDLSLGARLSAVVLLPITAGLIALGPALTSVIFVGRTDFDQARHIGVVVAMSAFGLLPFALVMLQLRVFYAMRDARTPTLINICMVAVKVLLVLAAAATFDDDRHIVEALNVSTSLSYVVGAVVGYLLLTRRFGRLGFAAVGRTVLRISVPSILGGLAAWEVVRLATGGYGENRGGSLAGLFGGVVVGVVVLVLVAWRMRIPEVRQIMATVRG